jgi:electron transfer flavoprotein beta subunit
MKILVCISKAPDTTSKIAFSNGNTSFDENGIQYIINPYDEWYALVRALEITEAGGGEVTILSVGGADYDPIMRKALAIGANSAVRIDVEPTDALYVAHQIASYARENSCDMVFVGKETINYNGAAVGGMVAELLGWPYVANATRLDVNGSTSTVVLDVQGGSETVKVNGSLVLSASKGMAEQRIPNMRGIMAARTKPLAVIAPSDAEVHTKVISYELPPAKAACRMIDAENAAELIKLLHEEAKVI